MHVDIPTLETERLILRAPREADFPEFAAFGESDRSRWVGGPYPRFRSWGGFLGLLGHWALRGYGFWMVEEKATGYVAGRVGCAQHDGWEEPELGWHIFDGFEGRSIGFEASKAARAYTAKHFGLDGVISYIAPANTRSIALAKRLDAQHERDGDLLGNTVHIYRHPKMAEAA